VSVVKDAVLTCVTAVHSSHADISEAAYPHLRTLLRFDTREFFNVLALAFDDMAPDKKQRIVDILLLIMVDGSRYTPTQVRPAFIRATTHHLVLLCSTCIQKRKMLIDFQNSFTIS